MLGLFDPAAVDGFVDRLHKRLESAGLEPKPHRFGEPELARAVADELIAGNTPVIRYDANPAEPERRYLALAELARQLDTRKLVLVRPRGALRLASERREQTALAHQLAVESGAVTLVNLRTDRELLLDGKLLRREDAELLEHAALFLNEIAPSSALVSITSPLGLLTELFTLKGAGTLIKPGSPIARLSGYAEADRESLARLIASSFGAELDPGFFSREPLALFVEQAYRAVAIVEATGPAPYLSKFAVEPMAQGEGIGRDLWQALSREFPRMFWRTRASNPISTWYTAVSDGMQRVADWHVFWRGIEPRSIPELVDFAVAMKDDFVR